MTRFNRPYHKAVAVAWIVAGVVIAIALVGKVVGIW